MVEFGMEPRHGKRGDAARTDAHGRSAVRIFGQFDVRVLLDERQHFVLHPLGIGAGDGVVFKAALAALRILSAGADSNCHHRRQTMLLYEIVEDREKLLLRKKAGRTAIADDDERRLGAGFIFRRNIDVDRAGPDPRVTRRHEQVRTVTWSRLRTHYGSIETAVGMSV